MMGELTLATRGSELALAQTAWVADRLRQAHPRLDVGMLIVESSGDRDRISPVAALTEMGAFVRSLQYAVLEGRADAAVHSCKDLPTDSPDGISVAAFPQRANPFDVLIGADLGDLARSAVIGTGSPRRRAQLSLLRPDVTFVELRGNIGTRIRKVREGNVDAAILAAAGLERLGRGSDAAHYFTLETMIPAPAQGSLAVEAMVESEAYGLLSAIDDPGVRLSAETERLVLSETGAGCRSALGAYAVVSDSGITLHGFVDDEGEPRRFVAQASTSRAVVEELVKGLKL